MAFTIFQANKKAKAAEVNANFAFIAGSRIIAIDASTGAPFATFPIGDLTAITNGSLAGDLSARSGKALKVYNASGTLLGSVSYDAMLNLQDASETQKGVAEIATQTEANDGTDDTRIITPLKLKTRQGVRYVGRLTASGSAQLEQAFATGKSYYFKFINIVPTNNNSFFTAQYSTDAGSSWINSNYRQRKNWASTSDADSSRTDKTTGLTLAGTDGDGNTGVGNTSTKGLSGEFEIINPSAANYKQAHWYCWYRINTSFDYLARTDGIGEYNGATTAINRIRFIQKLANSDTNDSTIASGYIDVWEFNS